LVSPRGQRESAVLVALVSTNYSGYPSSPAEGLTPKTFVSTVPTVQWFDRLTMSGSNFARPEFIEGCAPFKSLKLTVWGPDASVVPDVSKVSSVKLTVDRTGSSCSHSACAVIFANILREAKKVTF
jgi:hypothetical protein